MKDIQLRKISRRIGASFISIPVLFNALIPVYAVSWPVKQNNENEISEVYINPLYEDVVEVNDLKEPDQKNGVSTLALEDEEVPVFETMEDASSYLRDEMEARNESIEVKVLTDGYYNGMMKDLSDMALVHTGVPTEGDYIRWQFGGWKTKGSISDVNGKELVDVIYTVTYYTSAEQEKEVDQKVEDVLDELSPLMVNRPETVEAIYDYICNHVAYDHDHLNDSDYKLQFTAYGALIDQTSVCQGYSVLLYRLLLEKGIDTRVITGTGQGNPHGWNIVQLGDYYYNADSTWDAGDTSKSWYLLSPDHFVDHIRDSEYASAEFASAYPMATEDYKKVYSGTINWSDDYGYADSTFTVSGDSITYTMPATVKQEGSYQKPTCTEPGRQNASAEGQWKNGNGKVLASVQDKVDQEVPPLGHAYAEVEFEWNGTKEATAITRCIRCDHQLTKTVQAVQDEGASTPATCEREGVDVYRVDVEFKDADGELLIEESDSKSVTSPKTLHTPSLSIQWDNESPTVEATCEFCHKILRTNQAITELKDQAIEPTCMNEGVKVLQVSVDVLDDSGKVLKTITDDHRVTVAKLSHEIDETSVEFVWNEYIPVSARAKCKVQGEWIDAVEVTVEKDEKRSYAPTSTTQGKNVYVATAVFKDGEETIATFKDEKTEVLPKNEVTAMYRLYNPNSGEHFYTANPSEKQMLVDKGWTFESIGWYAPVESDTPVYRLYNPNAGDHHYTKEAGERDILVSKGWIYERIGWYSCDEEEVPLYRQYNPNAKQAGTHNYTTNKAENDHLVSLGWREEGIGWYGCKS